MALARADSAQAESEAGATIRTNLKNVWDVRKLDTAVVKYYGGLLKQAIGARSSRRTKADSCRAHAGPAKRARR